MAARNGLEAPVNDDVGVFSLRQMGVETVFGRMCGGQETVEKYSERRRGEAHDYHIVARRRREALVPRDGREIAPTVSTPDRTGHPLPKKDEPWESIILWLTLGLG